MATRVTLNTVDGELVVDKVALEGDRSDRSAEARWLAEARHPAVIRLVSFEDSVLRTRHAGQTTLRTAGFTPPETAHALLSLAKALAALHNRGLVHGKLTLDHVIVSRRPISEKADAEGPAISDVVTRSDVVLCSPDGTTTDISADLHAIGAMIERLLERWDETGTPVSNRADWKRIRDLLEKPDGGATAQRLARWLAPLVISAPPKSKRTEHTDQTDDNPWSHRLPNGRGLAVLACFVACVVGVTVMNPLEQVPDPSTPRTEISVGEELFHVDGQLRAAAGAPIGCPPEAAVIDDTSTVWRFLPTNTAEATLDGTAGDPIAVVPGATELSYEACELWAIGPAGRTLLVEK